MKNYKLYMLFLLLLVATTGCRKYVELDAPKTLLVSTNAFLDDATAITTVTGIYAKMVDQDVLPFRISLFTGLQSDELKSAFSNYTLIYQNSLTATEPYTTAVWLDAYNFIYQANAVYEGCTASTTLSAPVKKQLMAEAMFIRAFWYFYLVNLYGDVPLITTTDYQKNSVAARTSKEQVYQQIISDSQYAKTNLNKNYVDPTSIGTATDRFRPNQATATALLARVYLYHGDYALAETQASEVIAQTVEYTIETIARAFLADSKEAIWQMMKPQPASINTHEGNGYVITTRLVTTGERQSTTISTQLLAAFESNDLRKSNWIGKKTDASGDIYFPYKYKIRTATPATEHSIVFRLAEQYLIRAEARAQTGKLPDAIDDIDMVRKRAGIPLIKNVNPGISQSDLIKAILKEKQTELFVEWGHRWLDLKRTGYVNTVMNTVTPLKGGTWDENKQLWPIPQKDIDNDRNLKQNEGYN